MKNIHPEAFMIIPVYLHTISHNVVKERLTHLPPPPTPGMKDIHPEAFDELSFASHFNVSHNLLSNMSQVESDLNLIFCLKSEI